MKFEIGSKAKFNVVNLVENDKKIEDSDLLRLLVKEEVFSNKKQEIYVDYNVEGESTLYVGLGNLDKLSVDDVRKAYHKVGKTLMQYKVKAVNIDTNLFTNSEDYTMAAIEGLLQSEAVFDKYLSSKKVKPTVETVYIAENADLDLQATIAEMTTVYEGVEITRELVNERPMHLYPQTLADHAVKVLEPVGVKVDVLGKDEIKALNMENLLNT